MSNSDALAFHLDLFLASPLPTQSIERGPLEGRDASLAPSKRRDPVAFGTDLERRAYDAVVAAGGSAIAEPRSSPDVKYRPDLLAWLGHLDSELLDPTVIEVRHHADLKSMRQLENRLLGFMQSARIRSAFILTAMPTLVREQQASPNIFWLTIDEFETLARTERLADFVRRTRNRVVHGAR